MKYPRTLQNRTNLYTKYRCDVKFGANLIQLLLMGNELMITGRIQFPLNNVKEILDIKNGKYSIQQIIEWSEYLSKEAEDIFENKSILPKSPRTKEIENFTKFQVRLC